MTAEESPYSAWGKVGNGSIKLCHRSKSRMWDFVWTVVTTGRNSLHITTSTDEKQIAVMNLNAQNMICSADKWPTHHCMSDAFSFSVCSVVEKTNTVSNHLSSLMTHDAICQSGVHSHEWLVKPIMSTENFMDLMKNASQREFCANLSVMMVKILILFTAKRQVPFFLSLSHLIFANNLCSTPFYSLHYTPK